MAGPLIHGSLRRDYKTLPGTKQPDSELEYQEDGRIQGMLITKGDADTIPDKLERFMFKQHPDESRAVCYNIKRREGRAGLIFLHFSFIGMWQSPTAWFVDFQGSISQEAIETHPEFSSKIGGTIENPLNGAVFDQETGEFIGFPANATNELGGVTSYYVPSVVAVFSRWTNSKPSDGGLMGERHRPPDFVGGDVADYLVGPVTYRKIGPLYQASIAYLGSGPKGWNKIVYK